MEKDLFGQDIIKDPLLRDRFIEPPFTVLNSINGHWQKRKRKWYNIGIRGEIGRSVKGKNIKGGGVWLVNRSKDGEMKIRKGQENGESTTIFDPVLSEILYKWFCVEGGNILDPFAGGSVRGIVANYLGYKYTGIDIREEQINSNREQGLNILPIENQPQWYVGDSNKLLDDKWNIEFDMIMSCPPYADLEVYSDLEGDISNKPYKQFLELYESIIEKSCKLLKRGGYACFVVGEVRDKNGYYYGLIRDTSFSFEKCGMKFYNEAILLTPIGTGHMRVNTLMKSKKLVKIHQNILVFKKP